MATSTTEQLTGADKAFGYRFGCEGLMSVYEACRFLGGISRDMLDLKVAAGLLRKGRHPAGKKIAICRRSVANYVAQMET